MTEKRANEILRSKYPEATIFKRNSYGGVKSTRLAVTFKDGGKVYDYYGLSYQQVLEKLGFNVLYKHNVEFYKNEISKLEKKVEDGKEENQFYMLFDEGPIHIFSNEEIKEIKNKIEEYNNILNTSIIC